MACSALRQVSSPILLIPAYGRSYPTAEAMREAWESGKDFKVYGWSGYCSVRDLDALRHESSSIQFRDPRSGATFAIID